MRTRTVFIVDDQSLIADTLGLILQSEGYRTRTFYSPQAVIAAASETEPDILITDFLMPDMDGLTLALKIRALNANCTVLVMSGNVLAMDGHPARECFPVIEKPLPVPELLKTLEQVVNQ